MIRIGVLVSGSGSNLQAILDAVAAKKLDAEIAVVVSNIATAGGLERARAAGVTAVVIDHKGFANREDFDAALVAELHQHQVDYVVLAGFMRIVTEVLLGAFPMRVVNVHPALLPAFPGVNAQKQAFNYGSRVSGCTVHFVDAGTDTGPVIAQAVVPVLDGDDEATLKDRILVKEHALLPMALQWIAEGRVAVKPPNAAGERPRVTVEGIVPVLGLAT